MNVLKFFCAVVIIFNNFVNADIKDFIVTKDQHTQLGEVDNLQQEDGDFYGLDEYDSCGYENPAEKYFYDQADEHYIGEMGDGLIESNAVEVLENMMREQEISLHNIQELFAQLSANPKYAAIFKQLMAEESFDVQPSCLKSAPLDIFTNNFGDDVFTL